MAEVGDRYSLALGELRGLLTAFAWANEKCNHSCTFSVEELPAAADIQQSLAQYYGDAVAEVRAVELSDWHGVIGDALQRWLFLFRDLIRPRAVCALTDERCQRAMVGRVLDAFMLGLEPLTVWRVEIEPRGFYECTWDDFAIRGSAKSYLLHLGVSD